MRFFHSSLPSLPGDCIARAGSTTSSTRGTQRSALSGETREELRTAQGSSPARARDLLDRTENSSRRHRRFDTWRSQRQPRCATRLHTSLCPSVQCAHNTLSPQFDATGSVLSAAIISRRDDALQFPRESIRTVGPLALGPSACRALHRHVATSSPHLCPYGVHILTQRATPGLPPRP